MMLPSFIAGHVDNARLRQLAVLLASAATLTLLGNWLLGGLGASSDHAVLRREGVVLKWYIFAPQRESVPKSPRLAPFAKGPIRELNTFVNNKVSTMREWVSRYCNWFLANSSIAPAQGTCPDSLIDHQDRLLAAREPMVQLTVEKKGVLNCGDQIKCKISCGRENFTVKLDDLPCTVKTAPSIAGEEVLLQVPGGWFSSDRTIATIPLHLAKVTDTVCVDSRVTCDQRSDVQFSLSTGGESISVHACRRPCPFNANRQVGADSILTLQAAQHGTLMQSYYHTGTLSFADLAADAHMKLVPEGKWLSVLVIGDVDLRDHLTCRSGSGTRCVGCFSESGTSFAATSNEGGEILLTLRTYDYTESIRYAVFGVTGLENRSSNLVDWFNVQVSELAYSQSTIDESRAFASWAHNVPTANEAVR